MTDRREQTLVIDNRLGEFIRVEAWLAGLADQWGLAPKTAFAVDLVVNEAVTNTITHGYVDDRVHAITITLSDTDAAVTIEVVDDAEPFNPLDHRAANVVTDLDHAAIGGRGIQLIRTYADRLDYSFLSGCNRLKLGLDKQQA